MKFTEIPYDVLKSFFLDSPGMSIPIVEPVVTYSITSTVTSGSGIITPLGAVSVLSGATQNFTISPSSGYTLSEVFVDSTLIYPAPSSYSFVNVSANHTISVAFSATSSYEIYEDYTGLPMIVESGNGCGAFVIDESGRMWVWGGNQVGDLGIGNPYLYSRSSPGLYIFTIPDMAVVASPLLVYTDETKTTIKNDWRQIQISEETSMALDSSGVLWGTGYPICDDPQDCASFGLLNGSGDSAVSWYGGTSSYKSHFWYFTQCTPGYTWSKYMHNGYFTLAVGKEDGLLYAFGDDIGDCATGIWNNWEETWYVTPTRVSEITDTIRFIGMEGDFGSASAIITTTNKLYMFGSDVGGFMDSYDPALSGGNCCIDFSDGLPENINKVQVCCAFEGALVLLENGDVWGRGECGMIGNGEGPDEGWGEDSWYEWKKIEQLSKIRHIAMCQDGCLAIDNEDRLWTWGYTDYGTGIEGEDTWYWCDPALFNTELRFHYVSLNYYSNSWIGLTTDDVVVTWGGQGWRPMLGLGVGDVYDTSYIGSEEEPIGESYIPVYPTFDETLPTYFARYEFEYRTLVSSDCFADKQQGDIYYADETNTSLVYGYTGNYPNYIRDYIFGRGGLKCYNYNGFYADIEPVTGDYTFSLWFKFDNLNTGWKDHSFYLIGPDGQGVTFTLQYDGANYTIDCYAYDNLGNSIFENYGVATSAAINTWYKHEVIVSGRNITVKFNGNTISTGTAVIDNPMSGVSEIYVQHGTTNYLWIDKLRVY